MRQRMGLGPSGAKRGPVTEVRTVPAPIGGLNARDSIAGMKPTDAVILDNWVPGTSNVTLRAGYRAWATGLGASVESLMPYRSGSTVKMFAAAGTHIYDVTAKAAVGAAAVSALANARFQWINFGTPGGHFLLAVNNGDPMQRYDGAAWTNALAAPAVTGFDTTKAIGINAYGERVWFVEKDSFNVWYLPLQSIGGAATQLDLSSLFGLGGSLAGMITWTVAGSQATISYAAFVSTEGEVIIFQGDNPASATTWARTGQARIGRPIGRRFWTRVGTDVALICADGFVPLSTVLQIDRATPAKTISNKIINAAKDAAATFGGNFGWQATLFPSGSRLIFNVPTAEDAKAFQFVMNTLTGAWCRYTGINANCWESTQDSLFFGGNGTVYQGEYGTDDDGAAIASDMLPAFNYFGDQALTKMFTQVRIISEAQSRFSASITLAVNFDYLSSASVPALVAGTGGSPWNTSPWNSSPWSASNRMGFDWQWAGGMGFCASARIRSNTIGQQPSIDAIAYSFERGGIY